MSSKQSFISPPIGSTRSLACARASYTSAIPSIPNTTKHFEHKTVNGHKIMVLVDKHNQQSKQSND